MESVKPDESYFRFVEINMEYFNGSFSYPFSVSNHCQVSSGLQC